MSLVTRNKVRKIANEMGYRPNPLVSALMAQQRMLRKNDIRADLAFISFHKTSGAYRVSYHEAAVVNGAQMRARELGYPLVEYCLYAPGMSARRMAEILRARATAGVFFGASLTKVWWRLER
ncbi:MAG: LacI family DNA-binding transcriptional regulator [Armatimonadetes bacterium]|nr:LacI family DNA-binding transcriptional regulator [Akkermansiaceae bacterium]